MTDTERNRETERERGGGVARVINRERDRVTDTERNRETEREREGVGWRG